MAVLTYKGGKYRNLAGNQIYDGSAWNLLKGDSKIFLNGKWHNFGWETSKPIGQDVAMPNYPGFDFKCSEINPEDLSDVRYATPTGAGKMDGSSWDNACAGIYAAMQYSTLISPIVFCSEGIYNEPYLYEKNYNAIIYGGFALNGAISDRNTLKYPTIINAVSDGTSEQSQGGFDGCIGALSAGGLIGCLCIGGGYINSVRDSVIVGHTRRSSYDRLGECCNSTFINCTETMYVTDAAVRHHESAFINCTLSASDGFPVFYAAYNILTVNCSFTAYVVAGGDSAYITIVNSEHVEQSKYGTLQYISKNSLMFSNRYSEATGLYGNDTLGLGHDNTLPKFKNIGYFPTSGVVDIGPCPSPIEDMQGFVNYVNSFGDWRPTTGSVLAYRGGVGSLYPTIDIMGITRPDKPTIGAYETLETEQ